MDSVYLIDSESGYDREGQSLYKRKCGTTVQTTHVGQRNAITSMTTRAGGTMTGQLLLDDSAGASAPAIAFDGDASTGIFRVGSNTIGFANISI